MQTANVRYVVLSAVLLVGAGLLALIGGQPREVAARWPSADEVFAVQSWSVGAEKVEPSGIDIGLVSRVFRSPSGTTATLTIVTSKAAKIYSAGTEVPFLGSGYSVEPIPVDVASHQGEGIGGLVASRGAERWLLLSAFGERRGLLGNGPKAWSLALLDGVAGSTNDYYKMYLITRADRVDSGLGIEMTELARTIFPRIASWYAVS